MADPIITTGELLAGPDGNALPAQTQAAEALSTAAADERGATLPTGMSAEEAARAKAAFDRQGALVPPPPSVAQIPTQLKPPSAGVPPPPSAAATWMANTPYAESQSRAAAAAKGLIDPVLGAAQLGERVLRAPLEMSKWVGDKVRGTTSEAPTYASDEATRSIHNVLGGYHPELSPKTEIAGAAINPIGTGVGKALDATKGANLYLKGAAAGVAGGASAPVDEVEKYWGTKLGDMGWGAALGAGTSGISKVVGATLAPRVQKAVETLKAQGLDPSKLTLGQLLGGKAASFENWVRDTLPGSGIKPAQGRGLREFQVAPLRQVGQSVGHAIDEGAPIPKIAADLVGGTDEQGNKVRGAVADTYAAGRASAPLIPAKAVPNNAGTGFRMNVGTPRVFAPLQKQGEEWAADGSVAGKEARNLLAADLREAVKPFKLDPANGSYHYADPTQLHDSIKYLNGRITDVGKAATNDSGNPYHKKMQDALIVARNHLRDLWENTDQGSFDKIRAADRAHGAVQTLLDAGKRATVPRGGAYTPDDLLRASALGENARDVVTRSTDYAPYATAGQEVFGHSPTGGPMTLPQLVHMLGTKGLGALGAATAVGAGPLGYPAVAAGAAGLGLGSLAASRALYGPTGQLGNRWANSSEGRLALRDALESVPSYLGGAASAKP